MAKKAIRSRVSKKFEEQHYIGSEVTDWNSVPKDKYEESIRQCIKHYNYFYDYKDAKEWTLEWMKYANFKPEDIKKADSCPAWAYSITAGWYCRIMMNGGKVNAKRLLFVHSKIRELTDTYERYIEKSNDASPAELLKRKTGSIIAELEGVVDGFFSKNVKGSDDFSLYDFLTEKEAAYATAKSVKDYYEPILEQVKEAQKGKDDQLKEGYSHLTKTALNRYVKFLEKLVSEVDMFMAGKKVERKPVVRRPRKAKPKKADFSKLSYLKKDDSLKATSTDPEKLDGSLVLYTFNVKTRTLTCYIASDLESIRFKGTSVTGFDENKSFTKKIRKPEEFMSTFLLNKKTGCKKAVEAIKAKPGLARSRINSDTLLLKGFK